MVKAGGQQYDLCNVDKKVHPNCSTLPTLSLQYLPTSNQPVATSLKFPATFLTVLFPLANAFHGHDNTPLNRVHNSFNQPPSHFLIRIAIIAPTKPAPKPDIASKTLMNFSCLDALFQSLHIFW